MNRRTVVGETMNENLAKMCRICLTEGSRHIFQKTVTHDAMYNVSSLNRISEKLRYVTLLKIDEMENLPPMICDLCIVQLNVAYNFKRQATESDTKLRQYLIENGIDIMKDVRSVPAIRSAEEPTVPARTLTVPNRTNHRINSVSSVSVFEVPTNPISSTTANRGPFEPRLIPIRIKVETPEATEQSSETGDLLSTSTISPLSTGTAPVATVASSSLVADKTISSENIVIDSSPSSSKGSLSTNGRDSAMVVVSSQNINLQSDEDYVQTFLGSTSSLATNADNSVKNHTSVSEKSTSKSNSDTQRSMNVLPDHQESTQEKRLKNLLSSLRINMVTNARFPQSKLRIKPRKKLQKLKQKQQIPQKPANTTPETSKKPTTSIPPQPDKSVTQAQPVKSYSPPQSNKIIRIHSVDLAKLFNGTRVKKDTPSKSKADKHNPAKKPSLGRPRKLNSLKDMIRQERVVQKEKKSSKCLNETSAKSSS